MEELSAEEILMDDGIDALADAYDAALVERDAARAALEAERARLSLPEQLREREYERRLEEQRAVIARLDRELKERTAELDAALDRIEVLEHGRAAE